jgi:hypothetical protein
MDCVEHQDKILAAYEEQNFGVAREVARDFLKRRKEYLSTRLVPSTKS